MSKKDESTVISIDDEHRIEVDRHNYTLQERGVVVDKNSDRHGEEYWKPVGYYSSPGGALFACLKLRLITDKRIKSVETLVERMEFWATKYNAVNDAMTLALLKNQMKETASAPTRVHPKDDEVVLPKGKPHTTAMQPPTDESAPQRGPYKQVAAPATKPKRQPRRQ